VAKLSELGFELRAHVKKGASVHQVVEVFPHPAMVELFGLERTLKYKSRKGRTLEFRLRELSRYVELLRSLKRWEPALAARALLPEAPIHELRGKALRLPPFWRRKGGLHPRPGAGKPLTHRVMGSSSFNVRLPNGREKKGRRWTPAPLI